MDVICERKFTVANGAIALTLPRVGEISKTAVPAVLASLVATAGYCCSFHNYLPEKTAINWIIESDRLVLARNSREDEFVYQPVTTLRGQKQTAQISDVTGPGLRGWYAEGSQKDALLAFDEEEQAWRFAGYFSPEYETLVQKVLGKAAAWESKYTADRLALFGEYLGHSDEKLRNLALRDIDQAPYSLLRTVDFHIPAQDLLAGLWTLEGYPDQPISVLLLGFTDDAAVRRELYNYVDRVSDTGVGNNIGAFATALVEIDGIRGLKRLENKLFSNSTLPLNRLEQVIEALAIHGDVGRPELQDEINNTIARLVAKRHDAAAVVARQFGGRKDWSQTAALEFFLQQGVLQNTQDLLAVAIYVAQGREALRGASDSNFARMKQNP
ncbi:MAG: hypothetical protein R8G34_01825 [Paracoccaceae bacterium]|nr:hypothetical protein [Paracoccaceae bacterium]